MFETERISVVRGLRQRLAKVLLFQLRGFGYSQDDTISNFFNDSYSSKLGVSNKEQFISEFLLDGNQTAETFS